MVSCKRANLFQVFKLHFTHKKSPTEAGLKNFFYGIWPYCEKIKD